MMLRSARLAKPTFYITENNPLNFLLLTILILFLSTRASAQSFKQGFYNPFPQNKPNSFSVADTQSALTRVGQWGWGPCNSVAVKGNYAYIGNGYVFQVLDISDPANPKIVGELLTDAQIYSVTISGNYAYTVNPFRIIDISDPTNPVLKSSIDALPAAYPANNVKVKGNYAYLGDWGGFITIIDISNPSNPQTLGLMNVPGDGVSDLAVKDTILYAKSVDNFGIYVFNISKEFFNQFRM